MVMQCRKKTSRSRALSMKVSNQAPMPFLQEEPPHHHFLNKALLSQRCASGCSLIIFVLLVLPQAVTFPLDTYKLILVTKKFTYLIRKCLLKATDFHTYRAVTQG